MRIGFAMAAAAAAIAATGCGGKCPTETPKVDAIASCTAHPGGTVSYPIQLCDLSGVTCDVDMTGVGAGSGTIFLDPKAEVCGGGSTSCPASCANPPPQVACSFAAPSSEGTYVVSVYDPCGNTTRDGTLTVSVVQSPSCAF